MEDGTRISVVTIVGMKMKKIAPRGWTDNVLIFLTLDWPEQTTIFFVSVVGGIRKGLDALFFYRTEMALSY